MILHDDPLCTLYLGDCVEVMAELPAESVDAIVTDPPYGIRFMGKAWDGADIEREIASLERRGPSRSQAASGRVRAKSGPAEAAGSYDQSLTGHHAFQSWCTEWAREAFRVAKPGAHLLAFGGTRTYHRLASAIEDAGWEIRDCLVWAYASGFPKSLDVSKAIDKKDGRLGWKSPNAGKYGGDGHGTGGRPGNVQRTADFEVELESEEARKWDGWGTALKPAWEPIVMARKPLRGTVAANVLAHGTGALNIDATRIGPAGDKIEGGAKGTSALHGGGITTRAPVDQDTGRWPANLILTDPIFDGDTPGVVGGGSAPSAGLYREPDELKEQGKRGGATGDGIFEDFLGTGHRDNRYAGDSGTYSRFFLIPKSSRSDREPVLRGQLEEREVLIGAEGHKLNPMTGKPVVDIPRENAHPTVKPLDLMRHLVRLVTPPGGVVLDCFAGSGTTGLACSAEGFRCLMIEKEQEYCDIILARLVGTPVGMGL